MKRIMTLLILLLTGTYALAQQTATELPSCDCPDCRAKAASGDSSYTLSGLEGLNADDEAHNHDPGENGPADEEHSDHDGHDHEEQGEDDHDDREGHDHAEHDLGGVVVDVHDGPADEVGIRVYEAEGGAIVKTSAFPAEIKLNRDRTATVSPRYASIVRQVFAEIGDEVEQGDILASLENRETLAVYTVAAPLAGVVIAKDLSVGETADADKALYEIADLSSVWADISIFPQYQHLIKKGERVEFVAHDGHRAQGIVKYISPIVSHETRTFTARCILQEAGVDFTPGAFVRALIRMEVAEVDVRVERAAVQSIDGEPVVFVPGEHGYEAVEVETGLSDDHFVEIKAGLSPGDHYVASGAFTLKAELVTSGMDPHAGHSH